MLACGLLALPVHAAIHLLSDFPSTIVSAASTNFGTIYNDGSSDTFIPKQILITHTNLVTTTNLTLVYRVTFDGGLTWANVTTTNLNTSGWTNWQTGGTTLPSETWNLFGNGPASVTRSNQVVAYTLTNANFSVISAWQQ